MKLLNFFKPTLIYCPLLYRWDKGWSPPTIPEAWYFNWQFFLWHFLAERKDIKVIWSAPPATSNLYDPIKELRARNIEYVRGHISNLLRRADFVFVDFPSSTLWDAVSRGLPALCITPSWDQKNVRKDAAIEMGIKIISAKDFLSEATRLLGEWLDSPVKLRNLKAMPSEPDWPDKVWVRDK